MNFIIKNWKVTHFPQKIYKLSKTNTIFLILREREEKKPKYFAPKYSLYDFTNNLDNRTFQQNQKKKR